MNGDDLCGHLPRCVVPNCFGAKLWAVVQLYGGSRTAARIVGVPRWTLYRWRKLTSADNLQVGTLARLTSAFPELKTLLEQGGGT